MLKFTKYLAEVVFLFIILFVGAYLRLTNLHGNPGWYSDEATHVDIARHLLDGRAQYMLINQSTLLFGRLPLFHLTLARWFGLVGAANMSALRTFTGLLGVLSVALLYVAVRRTGGAALALLAALALAVYPQAVLYNRFGFSYNLLPPLILLMVFSLDLFAEDKGAVWLILAALALGLCLITEVMALTLIIPFILAVARRPLHLLWSLPLACVPLALYALAMLISAPDAFLFDLRFTVGRLGNAASLAEQWDVLLNNYLTLLKGDLWMLAGIAGLFALPARLRWICLLLFVTPIVSIGRNVALYNLSAYYQIPLLPLIALGVGALIRYSAAALYQAGRGFYIPTPVSPPQRAGEGTGVGTQPAHLLTRIFANSAAAIMTGLALAFLIGAPLSVSIPVEFDAVRNGYQTEIDSFLIDASIAEQVAAYVNASVQPGDTIIASPVVGWQFDGHPMDLQQAVAAQNRVATPHLPADIPLERFAFSPDYRQARYVVIDNLWRNWGVVHIPGLDALMGEVESNWRRVFEAGDFVVYENPAF